MGAQFAIIDKVPVGSSRVSFQFVAAIEPNEDFDSKKLKFKSLKVRPAAVFGRQAAGYPMGGAHRVRCVCSSFPRDENREKDVRGVAILTTSLLSRRNGSVIWDSPRSAVV